MKRHSVEKTRRQYNRWVATETIEDYALRYAPSSFRKWSALLLANTAIGSISFLACEAIGASLLLSYGYTNAVWAIVLASIIIFAAGLPISYYAARYNIDIDLLTRSAGFGYVGSTVTSLIYASFCFIFFALEAAIMAQALKLYFELPLYLGYIVCSLVIIPIVFYGITAINRLHLWTQPLWLILMLLPLYFLYTKAPQSIEALTHFKGQLSGSNEFDPYYFGIAAGISFSLIAQIGEQVDYLRFMPDKHKGNRLLWWSSMLAAGPGWVVLGCFKQLVGALLASIAVLTGLAYAEAKEPVQLYYVAYTYVFDHPSLALIVSTVFVVTSQIKINVTNAYAGSLAWSNFFSRVTHAHPGRVVWLVFNIGIALLLMELGVFEALQKILGLYSNVAIAWISAVVADLTINKLLKLSPPLVEFKRAHLHDYNPVGFVSMLVASLVSIIAFTGAFGLYAQAYSWLIAMMISFMLVPIIAKLTKGEYYIARQNVYFESSDQLCTCEVCKQQYAQTDFAYCTFHEAPICSLCCTLDSNCKDQCKPKHISIYEQAAIHVLGVIFNHKISTQASVRIARFVLISGVMLGLVGLTFWLTYSITSTPLNPQVVAALSANLLKLFCVLAVLICILAWWIVLGHESQALAETELEEQNQRLELEITERRQAEMSLKESETFHRAVFDATPDAMFLSDEQGIITQVNQQAECLLGYQTDEIIGLSIDVLLPERLRAGHKVMYVKFTDSPVARPMSLGMNVPALRKDGSEVNVEISLSPIQTKRGLIIASALRDVTQRKQIEDALRASEERFRRMANASPAMIWVTDVAGNPIFVNQTWLDFTGVEVKEAMTYEGWTKLIHPDDRESSFVAYYKNISAHEPILTEYRLRHADGDWRWILDKGVPLYTETGIFSGYIGSAIDITERKQAEAELRVAAVAFESQESIIITDADSVILRVNKAFTETSGYQADELIGQTPRLLKSDRHNADFYFEMWDTLNRTGSWQGEIFDRRKNGEIYPKYLTISAVKGDNGAVSHYVGTHLDITLSKAASAEIERLAFYDPLTGLPNRRLLQDRLKLALASSHRSGRKGALLFIDMDNFKTLNDTLGHDMGDLLLQQVAGRLESCIREGDTVARLGGDEFVVMMEDLSEQAIEAATQTEIIGKKIMTVLNQPYQLASHDYHSTPSIGAILFNNHEQTIEELLKQADIAMYQAKSSGRNALRFFDPQMQVSIAARAAMEADLHRALAEHQFMLYYQPQVYHNHQIIGAEVLIRWQHPQRGLVSPIDFIPLTEETGLILPIGQWVLETACAQIKLWEGSEYTRHLQLAVNVSARQFRQTDFVDQICQILRCSAINPNRLKLELTETLVLDNIDDTIIKMNALQKIGVRFSMDDFGTGYSSLAYLTQLPFNQLKIDQSFVSNIGMKPTDSMIVQTIIGMAKNLAMQVIAEGVETEAQRAFLEQYDCPLFQGFLISRPVPIEQFEQLLKPKNCS